MKKWLCVCWLVCVFTSCSNNVEYKAPEFIEKHPKQIRVLDNDYMFKYGDNPMLVDSLLITSTFNANNYIAVFNRYTGSLIKEFGRKGPGPNELATPVAFSVDKTNRRLYVCDHGKRALLCYDLQKVIETGDPHYKSIKIADQFARTSKMHFLKDSLFYAPAYKEGRMFVGTPSEIFRTLDSKLPDVNKFSTQEDWYNYMNSNSAVAVRPDGRYLAAGSALGGILEVFDLGSKGQKRVVLKHFYEPIFKQKGHVFRPIPETIGGFAYLAATDKYLYATLHGKANPTSMPTAICKFDWKGNPIERYDCGKYAITSFTVSEDDQIIYAIAIGEEGEQIILEIKL